MTSPFLNLFRFALIYTSLFDIFEGCCLLIHSFSGHVDYRNYCFPHNFAVIYINFVYNVQKKDKGGMTDTKMYTFLEQNISVSLVA